MYIPTPTRTVAKPFDKNDKHKYLKIAGESKESGGN